MLSDMFIIFFRKVQEIVDEGVFMCAYVWVRKGPNQRHLFIANDTDPRGKKYHFSLGMLSAQRELHHKTTWVEKLFFSFWKLHLNELNFRRINNVSTAVCPFILEPT